MTPKILHEASAVAPVKTGKRWRVVVATPGQGSSGYYSAELLKTYGPTAFPAGTKAWLDHQENRNLRDLVGTYPEGAYWNEDSQALEAELVPVTREWSDFLEQIGSLASASIYCAGEKDEADNVTALLSDRRNSIDMVGEPGLEGSGVKELLESARLSVDDSEKPSVTSAQGKEMMEKEILEAIQALLASNTALIATITESKDSAVKVEADAEAARLAAESAVDAYDARVGQIEAARESLLPSQVASLREAAKRGEDVAPLIESAKTVVEEAKSTLTESANAGRNFGETAPFVPTTWGSN